MCGPGHLEQKHAMSAGMTLDVVVTVMLTGLVWLLFQFVWTGFLW